MTQNTVQPNQQNLVYVTGRVSFPNIVDPQSKVNEKGETQLSYNCDLIFPQGDPHFMKFMQVATAMANDKWKENAANALQRIQGDRKTRCFGNGDEKVSNKTFQVHAGYAGNVFISARNAKQPQIIDVDGKPVDVTNTMQLRAVAAKIYAGCYANAVIRPWLQQNAQGIGIRCDLVAIQFARDGEPLGAGAADVTGFFGAVAGAAPQQFAQAPAAAQMPAAPFPGVAPASPQPQMTVPGGYPPPLGIPGFMQG